MAGQLSGIPLRVANAGILVVVPPAIASIALIVLAASRLRGGSRLWTVEI